MQIERNITLAPYSTFGIGGPAAYFIVVRTGRELLEALEWSSDQKLRHFVLGGGSNILFMSSGYSGVVIKIEFTDCTIRGDRVSVGAGVTLSQLIERTLGAGLTGMEFAAGIPGTVGGAIRGNAGTFGVDMSSVITMVHVVTERPFVEKDMSREECFFEYRHSIFKQKDYTIVGAELALKEGDVASSKTLIAERISRRREQHPMEPSAGCIFKNVALGTIDRTLLENQGIDVTPFEKYQKIPTGFLIEQLDLKGKSIGGAAVSAKHANYIVNTGHATSDEVIELLSLIKQKVRDTYGIQLLEEVQIVS